MLFLSRLALAAAALLSLAASPLTRTNNAPLGAAVDASSLVWTTGGATNWAPQTAVTQDGADAARATGLTTLDAESWIETTVTAPGVLSWHWRLELASTPDSVLELLVGTESSPREILTLADVWAPATLALDGSGSVKVRWRLRRLDDAPAPSADAAYLDTVAFTPFGPPVLQSPAGITARGFTARWTALPDATDYALELAADAAFTNPVSTTTVPAPATSLVLADLEPQTTYHTRLVAYGPEGITATSAPLSFTTAAIARPANDAFASASTLANLSGATAATNLEATLESAEPFAHQGSVWFRWTAPSAGRWRFQTAPSETASPSLFVYTGSNLAELDNLAQSTPGAEPGVAVLEFDAAAGLVYRLALDAAPAAQGPATLVWERLLAYVPPANDAFAAPTAFSGPTGSLDSTNLHATAEPSEPAPAARSVWFRWTAPASGLLTLDTTGSAIPTTLKVFSGSTLPGLSLLASDSAPAPSRSQLSLSVVSGTTYRVYLDGQDNTAGTLRLSWSLAVPTVAQTIEVITPPTLPVDADPFPLQATATSGLPVGFTRLSGPATVDENGLLTLTGQPGVVSLRATQPGDTTHLPALDVDFQFTVQAPPANDRLAGAIRLATPASGITSQLNPELAFATNELSDPFPARRSLWYRWNHTALGTLTLETAGGTTPAVLSVLAGPSADDLEFIAADTRADTATRLEITVEPGRNYWIAVDTLAPTPGPVRLSWSFTPPSLAQTIEFASLPDVGLQAAPFFLDATASSGLPVVFTRVSGPASLEDGLVTLTGQPGTVTLRASQPGDATYLPAPAVDVSFAVRPPPANDNASAALRLTGATGSATGTNLDASGESLDPFPASRSVWWRWTAPAVGIWTVDTAPGSILTTLAILTGPDASSLEILASDARPAVPGRVELPVAAGLTYWIVLDTLADAQGSVGFTWSLAPPSVEQTITFDQPLPDLIAGAPAPELFATASSDLPVTFSVVSGPARITDGALVLTNQPGTVTLRASQPGDATHLPAAPVTRSFVVAPLPKITLTFSDLLQTYDGTPRPVSVAADPAPRVSEIRVTYNGSATVPRNAGTYTVVATADTSRATAKLVIQKIPLTVTALDQRKLAGQPNPTLTLRYEGFAPGEDETTLATPPSRAPRTTTTARTTSPRGDYPIRVSSGISPNYTFSYVSGNLAVDSFADRYETLLLDTDSAAPVGKLAFAVTAAGTPFTGTLELPGEPAPLSFKGALSLDSDTDSAASVVTLVSGPRTYRLTLQLALLGDFSATLALNDAPLATASSGKRVFIPARSERLTWAGAHTLLLLPDSANASPLLTPLAHGHATATIDAAGNLRLAGRLPDATPLTTTLAPDTTGAYRLFARPYGKRLQSYVIGELPLVGHPDTARFPGRRHLPDATPALVWEKAPLPPTTPDRNKDKSYRAGFGPLELAPTLDPWLPPATRPVAITLAQRLGLASAPATPGVLDLAFGPAELDFGALGSSLPATGTLSPAGVFAVTTPVTVPANATKFTLRFTPSTGVFNGGFTLLDQLTPPTARPLSRAVTFTGILRQRPSLASEDDALVGAGHFLFTPLPDTGVSTQVSGSLFLLAP